MYLNRYEKLCKLVPERSGVVTLCDESGKEKLERLLVWQGDGPLYQGDSAGGGALFIFGSKHFKLKRCYCVHETKSHSALEVAVGSSKTIGSFFELSDGIGTQKTTFRFQTTSDGPTHDEYCQFDNTAEEWCRFLNEAKERLKREQQAAAEQAAQQSRAAAAAAEEEAEERAAQEAAAAARKEVLAVKRRLLAEEDAQLDAVCYLLLLHAYMPSQVFTIT